MPPMRSFSEPPEEEVTNLKTGLRGGFPIKINGQELGSQDNLQEVGRVGDIFGPRIRSRQSSVAPSDNESPTPSGRRLSLRGTTPVKIAGREFTTSAEEEPLFCTPFGLTQTGAGQNRRGGIMGKRPHTTQRSNNVNLNQNHSLTKNISASLLDLTNLQENVTNTRQSNYAEHDTVLNTSNFLASCNHIAEDKYQTSTSLEFKETKEECFKENLCTTSVISNTAQDSSDNLEKLSTEKHFVEESNIMGNAIEKKSSEYTEQKERRISISCRIDNHNEENITETSCNQIVTNESTVKTINRTDATDSEHMNLETIENTFEQSNNKATGFLLQRPKAFQKQNINNKKDIINTMNSNKHTKIHKENNDFQKLNHAHVTTNHASKGDASITFELPREITPFDLPILVPVSKSSEEKCTIFSVQDILNQDVQKVDVVDCNTVKHSNLPELEGSTEVSSFQEEKDRNDHILTDDDVKEYNVEAKIVLNSGMKNSIQKIEVDEDESQEQKLMHKTDFTNELQNLGFLKPDINVQVATTEVNETKDMESTVKQYQFETESTQELHNFDIVQHKSKHPVDEEPKTDFFLQELNETLNKRSDAKEVEYASHKNQSTTKFTKELQDLGVLHDISHDQIAQDQKEIFLYEENVDTKDVESTIGQHHKEVITECIKELEESTEFEIKENVHQLSEEATFTTEEIIDSEDLEHVFVMNKKTEERHNSVTSESINYCTDSKSVCETTNTSDWDTERESLSKTVTENEDDSVKDMDIHSNSIESFQTTKKDLSDSNSFFLTETSSDNDTSFSWQFKIDEDKVRDKRKRNRTIDYHNLPSLYWEGAVKHYHEKHFSETDPVEAEVQTEENIDSKNGMDIAKDGLSLILERLKGIESKLDSLKDVENTVVGRLDSRRCSLPGRFSTLPDVSNDMILQLEAGTERTPTPTRGVDEIEKDIKFMEDDGKSNCSTPTFIEMKPVSKMNGYESDSTIYQESDCEIVVDEKSDTDDNRDEKWTYKPFNLNISEISDLESEDEDPEERQRRIESLAAAIHLQNSKPLGYERGELNMEIDTLSERSEEEGEFEEQKPRQRSRRPSGRKRSMSRDRNVAKIRYCWRCHQAGHENWQCREDVQPGGWCPRCLETTHWEDTCWVEAARVQCPVCNVPGHLPCIHQATDFRQRKLVIDTFGWLPFKDWFQDLTFRSWWNCSGYTGVPLYKIMQRNPTQDLDLGFEDQ